MDLERSVAQARTVAIHQLAERCKRDLFFLVKEVLAINPDLITEQTHRELCEMTRPLLPYYDPATEAPEIHLKLRTKADGTPDLLLSDQFDPNRNKLHIEMPRGTFKSSIVTIGFTLQYFLNDPDARILIDSETYGKAKNFLAEIKGHLEDNIKFRDIFKSIHGVYPDDNKKNSSVRWTDSQVDLACRKYKRKEASITCSGIDKSINGMHFDLIIADDLHSEKNVTNKDQIDQVIEHYKLCFSLLDPGCPMIVIGCLTADSKVLMSDGTYLPINKVPVGSKVWSWDEQKQKMAIETVEAMIPQGKAPVYQVKTKRHSIKATGNHPFMTINGWKKAEELTKEDWLLTTKKINTDYRKKLPSGKFMDNDFAWLYGVLVGDGWVGKNDKRGYLAVAKGMDEQLNIKICDEIQKQFGKKPYKTKFGYYRLDSIKAQHLFSELGLVNGAKGKRIPEWLFKSRSGIKRAFLKGLIDADGHKQKRGSVYRIELANYKLVEDIRLLALTSGVRPTSIYTRTRFIQPPNSKKPVEMTSHSIGLTFQDRTENKSVYKKAWLLREQGIRIDRVESVVKLEDEQEVFDLTVSNTHNFIADGMIVHNTRWDYQDLYNYILVNERYRYNIIIRAAVEDDELLFPERLTLQFLDEQKRTQGNYIFSCQYMNNPVDDETATFKQSYFRPTDWAMVKDRPMNWFMAIDPSEEGPYSDYAAFVLVGMDYQQELYVKEIHRAKMNYSQIVNLMFDWYLKYKPRRIALETVATQKSIGYILNNEQKNRGIWLPVETIKSRTASKESRIEALAPYYEFGRVHHIKEANQISELEYELLHFPKGGHDDVIDALATILEIASPPTGMRVQGREREHNKPRLRDKPRSPVTGI